MSEECGRQCGECVLDCGEGEKTDFRVVPHELSRIKKVAGVVSGKGGVGKALVTSLLAVQTRRSGYQTAMLDADVTGPSVPKAFEIPYSNPCLWVEL